VPPASTPIEGQPVPGRVTSAMWGTYVAFGGSGFAIASWASRIPQVRAHLHLSPAHLGLLLLTIAAGSVLALPIAGSVVHRFSSRRTVTAMALLLAAALVAVAAGYRESLVPVVVIGLFFMGFANGTWDVAMNVQGAQVERLLGRSVMSRFHAGFSLGTVAGALVGVAMVALQVPVTAQLAGVAVLTALVVPQGATRFVPDSPRVDEQDAVPRRALEAWREPRTVLIGVFVLAFAFAEGAGNDWISLAMINGYGVPAAVGTLAFAMFLATMTLGRWCGPRFLDRFGRVRVLRATAALGIGGSLLFVFAPAVALAFGGVALWGVGASLGFPVGMSAAADEPRYAAGRVSVVASIAYCAFLAGPPAIGFLGNRFTVLYALVPVSVLLGLATLLSKVIAAPDQAPAVSAAP
jgi:MFS family permease